jgi:2-polyprenyl-3-methyl-5-hydroxy-6-metoxy-1,4-benzoquinol methylase
MSAAARGSLVNKLSSEGYRAYGIDVSGAMVEVATTADSPTIDTKCGNAMDAMSDDRGTFTHILCTHVSRVSHFQDKAAIFA